MDKKVMIDRAYDRGKILTFDNELYFKRVKDFLDISLEEDIFLYGDITTESVLSENKIIISEIRAKSDFVVAGLEEAKWFYEKHNIGVDLQKKDGDIIKSGEIIIKLKGKEYDILKSERTGLNLLQHMSSIATTTNNIIKKAEGKISIAATRKTRWGLLDKKAIFIGGGLTHRLGLWDAVLIKENHLEAIKEESVRNQNDYVEIALDRAFTKKKNAVFIEIEVETEEECLRAAKKFYKINKFDEIPCIVMLDNFSPEKIKKTIKMLKTNKLFDKIIIEASGGITPNNISEFAESSADVASMGFLTYSNDAVDISQRIIRNK